MNEFQELLGRLVPRLGGGASDPHLLYAGALDGESARVFRSDDGGETWQAQN